MLFLCRSSIEQILDDGYVGHGCIRDVHTGAPESIRVEYVSHKHGRMLLEYADITEDDIVQDLRDGTIILDAQSPLAVLLLLALRFIPFLEDELEDNQYAAQEIVTYLRNEWRESDSKATDLQNLRRVCTTFIRRLERQPSIGDRSITWFTERAIFEVVIAAAETQNWLLFARALACLEGGIQSLESSEFRRLLEHVPFEQVKLR